MATNKGSSQATCVCFFFVLVLSLLTQAVAIDLAEDVC